VQRFNGLAAAAWLAITVLICLIGEIAVMRLLPSLVVEPGFHTLPAAWFNNDIALQLPVRIVVVHILGSLPVFAIVITTVVLAGWSGWRFAASLDGARHRGVMLVSAQLFVGFVLALFPVTMSSDAHAYMLFGRLYALHGVNPYANEHLVVQPGSDAILARLSALFGQPLPWNDEYGPLFTLWEGAVARLTGGSMLFGYEMQRIAAVIAAAGVSIGLLWMHRAKADIGRRVGLFAFHPLVLCETAINGHNDMLMVAFAVGAFAIVDEMPLVAGLLFGASVAIKIVSIVVFPFFVAVLMRRSPVRGLIGAALAAAVVVLSFRPFWVGLHTIGASAKGYEYFFSPTYLINTLFFGPNFDDRLTAVAFPALHAIPVLRHATWPHLISLCAIALFAVVAVTLFVRFVRRRSVDDLFATMVAFVWSTPIFNPWYFVWLSPMVAWSGFWPRYVLSALCIALLYYPLQYGLANGVLFGAFGILVTVATFFVPLLFAWLGRRRALRQTPPVLDVEMVSS
jgi:glycosyl transferase family 87